MALKWPEPGIKSVGEYQVSAIPFVTSSALSATETREISFPKFTRFVIVRNQDATSTNTMALGFTQNGVQGNPASNSNYITLAGGESISVDVRVKSVFVSASVGTPPFEVFAGLTDIPPNAFLTLTGSNGFSGVG
jgi:hypothetical protein